MNCCEAMASQDKVVLGVRTFDGDDVPFKSRFGNNLTSFVFKAICGLAISDTQTGLRAIPYKFLQTFVILKGNVLNMKQECFWSLRGHRYLIWRCPLRLFT